MKIKISFFCLLLLISTAALADSLVVGTPSNSQLSPPTGFSPHLAASTVVNFDSLTPFTLAPSFTSNGIVVSSPDGLIAIPFSTQSFPIELFDNSANGTADITILLNHGVTAIGLGIADSDPVNVTFQALNSSFLPFGTAFNENLAATESSVNTGNGYYLIQDISADIFGIHITQPVGNLNFSGLAIDDVQIAAPEASSAALALSAIVFVIVLRKHLTGLKRT